MLTGLSYTLIFNPNGLYDRAPIHLDATIGANDNELNFVINQRPTKLTGTVVFDALPGGEDGARPRMRARLMLGSRLVSAVAEIDEQGKFSLDVSRPLFLEAENQPLNLIVEPIDQETALPRIKHKLDFSMLQTDFDVGDINVGALEKPVSVTFEIHGSDDSTIGNALLYLRAQIGAGVAVVNKQANQAGSTKFAHLYEGLYDIAVIPPVDSRFAMRVIKDVDIESKDNLQFFFRSRKTRTSHRSCA